MLDVTTKKISVYEANDATLDLPMNIDEIYNSWSKFRLQNNKKHYEQLFRMPNEFYENSDRSFSEKFRYFCSDYVDFVLIDSIKLYKTNKALQHGVSTHESEYTYRSHTYYVDPLPESPIKITVSKLRFVMKTENDPMCNSVLLSMSIDHWRQLKKIFTALHLARNKVAATLRLDDDTSEPSNDEAEGPFPPFMFNMKDDDFDEVIELGDDNLMQSKSETLENNSISDFDMKSSSLFAAMQGSVLDKDSEEPMQKKEKRQATFQANSSSHNKKKKIENENIEDLIHQAEKFCQTMQDQVIQFKKLIGNIKSQMAKNSSSNKE
ncbi:hypothetical protein ROZALSC1DRAFT_29620 [Rozella allomycis CSF55]|uniref:Uncharacterized protein n=1 Tax=Rozella allomycis (strain CSF55) TaxID=988480 RepID=A0A075AMK8_ROZAC|nr:hypothetical protein O9G_004962 [Rozella allomycis CSF55]RKP18708.1 hypothetical protein ROZALSC1DRAFT_29620 [Rozella allomycis CSF55]|eukprot:EPZ30866.1 hypothetical protein O9G_004962 [Rozella allomycis CSF55]